MNTHITTTIVIASLFLGAVPTARAGHPSVDVGKQAPSPAAGTDEPWVFSISPYLWMPLGIDVKTSLPQLNILDRTIGGDVSRNSSLRDSANRLSSVKDVLLTAQGRIEISKGHWGGFVDGYWLHAKLSDTTANSRVVLGGADIGRTTSLSEKFDVGQVNFGPRYLFTPIPLGQGSNGPSVAVEAYAGARINFIRSSFDGTVNLTAAALGRAADTTAAFSSGRRRTYAEPLLGLKSVWSFNDSFGMLVRGDVAGFGAVEDDHWDCDLEAAFLWRFRPGMSLDLGYRARGQWENLGANGKASTTGWFHGPELGFTFKF